MTQHQQFVEALAQMSPNEPEDVEACPECGRKDFCRECLQELNMTSDEGGEG